MIWRVTVSAFALMGVAHAQAPSPPADQAAPPNATPNATPGASSERTIYEPAFFAQFHPQNANDMVSQVPGFSLNGGDDRRGFSGAVGNLLIDGERPITKSQSLDGILSRIPANQVLRIEVLRGAAVAGDASGQSVLVNIVRTPTAGSGVWSGGAEYNRHTLAPQLDVSWAGRSGRTEYGLGVSYSSRHRSLPGDRRNYDAAGNMTSWADMPSPRNYREVAVSGNFATPLLGGRLSTTEQFDAWRFHSVNGVHFFTPTNTSLENFDGDFTERQWSIEVGINYDRNLGPWQLSLVSLLNRKYYSNDEDDIDVDPSNALNFHLLQATHNDSGETILRGSMARNWGPAHHVEFGVEAAHNSLDAQLDLTQDTGGGFAPLVIPNSNVLVEEDRVEAFASYTYRPNDKWSIETRVARESSTLTFTGDSNQSVELAYIKPSIQVSRNFSGNNSLRLRFYRDVGQLDFGDFVSASSAIDNLINGGNPNLKPQTDWRLDFGGDLHLPHGIAVSFTYTRHWISDAQDLVQIIAPGANPGDPPIRFDAPGNIGDASADQLVTNSTIPFEPFLPGAKLTLSTSYFMTTVTDPVTGRHREASGQSNFCTNGEIRQDINARHFTWGVDFERCVEGQQYRYNETDTQEEGPYVDVYAETSIIPNVKVRATLANTLNSPIRRQRLFYTPDRNGPLDHYEERHRQFSEAPWLVLTASGTF